MVTGMSLRCVPTETTLRTVGTRGFSLGVHRLSSERPWLRRLEGRGEVEEQGDLWSGKGGVLSATWRGDELSSPQVASVIEIGWVAAKELV